jgi:glycosyltransferase involved in cell wall biosynthesis
MKYSKDINHKVTDSGTQYQNLLVTVIIPTYNRANLLARAMHSVFKQSYRPIEMIIVDDGSTDQTETRLTPFRQQSESDPEFQFRYFRQENRGSQFARNRGLKMAQGKYVRFLDSDDWLFPDSTQFQVEMLEKTGAEVCYGDWDERATDDTRHLNREGTFSAGPMPDPIEALLGDKWCPSFCYLVRREVVVNAGGWDEKYQALQDRDFIQRIAYTGSCFVHVPYRIGCYYQHSSIRVYRRNKQVWLKFMKKTIYDGIKWLNTHSEWTEARRNAVARSLFTHARRYHRFDRKEFRDCIATLERIAPNFRPPGTVYPFVARAVGYEHVEAVRHFFRRLLRRL